ncbi:MAG: Stp1/IreP family PP2C-type Ser/Thr phosphatase [Bacillota bacterium]
MEVSVFFDKGIERNNNEDNYIIHNNSRDYTLIAVADGMGGHNAGEIASKTAIDCIDEYKFDLDNNIIQEIEQLILKANRKILKLSNENIDLKGMGTTLSLGLIYDNILYFGHIGDSRIYYFRQQNLGQLTTDHTFVNELIQQNKIKKEEAFNHPKSHLLTQALGIEYNITIDTGTFELDKDDLLLFCTDGITDMIQRENIEKIIRENNLNVNNLTEILGKTALKNGGKDNLTLVAGIIK